MRLALARHRSAFHFCTSVMRAGVSWFTCGEWVRGVASAAETRSSSSSSWRRGSEEERDPAHTHQQQRSPPPVPGQTALLKALVGCSRAPPQRLPPLAPAGSGRTPRPFPHPFNGRRLRLRFV